MKLIKTSFFSAIITFIRIASNFVAGKVVALLTGPAGVALIGQFSNFISIALTFANGAINSGVIKYTAEYEGDEQQLKKLFSTSLKISIYSSSVFGFLLLCIATYVSKWLFHSDLYTNPLRVLGCTIILYSLNSLLISILNGKKQIKTYTLVNTVGSVVGLVFTVVLVFFYKISGALYALVLAQSIVFFVTMVMVVRSSWFSKAYFNQPFDRATARNLSRFSLMAIVTALTVPVSQIILRNLVITQLGVNSAGYWQGMMRVSDGYLLLVTTSLSTYYLPKLSSLNNDEDMRKEIFQGYKIILPVVFVSCMLIYLLRFVIIHILYTKEFEAMSGLFIYQLIGDFFKMSAWILGYLMLAKAMTKAYIITEIVFSVSNVLLGYLCIHLFQLNGITIAFAINYFIYLIIMIVIFRKLLFK
ncbi:O-antigen translocase [Mucilaginibacter sp. SP1R1]|uniref:O-antigen translocase n=1 Tax=Mucilaginibacter sp. SP1R1 TaxID=2723091 RepID=UPI00161F7C7A|nr:O-antigen translocase [Mucilaginibacter sp. SP1R1]MBB6149558.1 PST family polysaccharide transporter [Mucilaginibacter sp. SP1R1]